ncbi:MAG: MBL fold metallo-hydrolase [Pseudomonadota bacterium]
MVFRSLIGSFLLWLGLLASGAIAAPAHVVSALKVTVLSTMLADGDQLGEWGYSALVEADGHKFLFDTGFHPDLVLSNARSLGVDLSRIDTVVLSHHHDDHTNGLVELRRELGAKNPHAMATTYVAAGLFDPRVDQDGKEENAFLAQRPLYEKLGGRFVSYDKPVQLAPGVWLTGPVPRVHNETNWSPGDRRRTSAGLVEDNIPEDSSIVIETAQGLVIITGCGHAGIVNISDYARKITGQQKIVAIIGGLHLFQKSDGVIRWTADQLRPFHPQYLLLGHCTGVEATYELRRLLGLTRATAVVSAVGSSFQLGRGIDPGTIAR